VKNYLKYLLSIALMAYVFVYYGNDIKLAIKEVNLLYLPLIILLSLLQYFLSAWRWYFIASSTKSRIDYKDAIKYYYISGFPK
jgi:NhaP-type Na+/H+ or K+/H+ antiporter